MGGRKERKEMERRSNREGGRAREREGVREGGREGESVICRLLG